MIQAWCVPAILKPPWHRGITPAAQCARCGRHQAPARRRARLQGGLLRQARLPHGVGAAAGGWLGGRGMCGGRGRLGHWTRPVGVTEAGAGAKLAAGDRLQLLSLWDTRRLARLRGRPVGPSRRTSNLTCLNSHTMHSMARHSVPLPAYPTAPHAMASLVHILQFPNLGNPCSPSPLVPPGRVLRVRAVQHLHLRAHLPRRVLVHGAPPGGVLDD